MAKRSVMGRILSFIRWISLAGLIAAIAGLLIKAWVPDNLGGIVGTALGGVPVGAVVAGVVVVAALATAAGGASDGGADDDAEAEDATPW